MNWNDLLNLKAWTPLKNISNSFTKLSDELYQISDNIFVVAQPYDSNFIEGLFSAPFVTLIYWAPSLEAIKHCVLQETQANNFTLTDPPTELLLGTNGSYSEILKLADRSSESAIYKSNDGSFLHKLISINNYSFFFLNQELDALQKPYAIEFSLRSS